MIPPTPKSTLFPYTTLFRSAKLRETQATGRIVLGIKPNDGNVENIPELPLEDGDKYTIPARPETVEVLGAVRSEEHTSELQSRQYLVCRLLLEKKKKITIQI